MSLSKELASRFAKVVNKKERVKKESTQYGTIKVRDNVQYVQLDGSNILTPMITTVEVVEGERVTVSIKDHAAIVTGNVTDPSASSNRVGLVYDTATNAITTADDAKTTASRASTIASNAAKKANDVSATATDAAKTADNYLYYDDQNGLQIGDKRSGSWSGFRTRITSTTFDILNEAEEVLASYGARIVELGKHAVDTVIKLCGGKGIIKYDSDAERLQIIADDIHVKGTETASVSASYTNNSGVSKNSAINVEADGGVQITSGINSDGSWDASEIRVTQDLVEMTSDQFNISGTMNDLDNDGVYRSCVTGTSGIWKYRKWSDGTVELWGIFSISNVACTTALGNMYRTGAFSSPSFPFSVSNPVVVASYESAGYGAMLWATSVSNSSAPPSYYLIRPTSATIGSGQINFYVRGTY